MPIFPVSKQGVFSMFEKWHSEKTAVCCTGAFFGCSVSLIGRADSPTQGLVAVRSLEDPRSVFVLRLDVDGCDFWYVEAKDVLGLALELPEGIKSVGAVLVSLPLRVSGAELEADVVPPREKVVFLELREGAAL